MLGPIAPLHLGSPQRDDVSATVRLACRCVPRHAVRAVPRSLPLSEVGTALKLGDDRVGRLLVHVRRLHRAQPGTLCQADVRHLL